MTATAAYALILIAGYLLGSIPFGLIVSKAHGVDVRQHGSGNIGATNVWRVLGRKWGLLTFFGDWAKGWFAVALGMWIGAHFPNAFRDHSFAGITAAIGCILGHSCPVWLKFKGGKGVATSLGVIVGMMPVASAIVFAIWGIVFKTSRYVSLASIVAALALPVVVIVLIFAGWVHGWANFYFACAAALLVIVRHRANINRLIVGTENRFGSLPAERPPEAQPAPVERRED